MFFVTVVFVSKAMRQEVFLLISKWKLLLHLINLLIKKKTTKYFVLYPIMVYLLFTTKKIHNKKK